MLNRDRSDKTSRQDDPEPLPRLHQRATGEACRGCRKCPANRVGSRKRQSRRRPHAAECPRSSRRYRQSHSRAAGRHCQSPGCCQSYTSASPCGFRKTATVSGPTPWRAAGPPRSPGLAPSERRAAQGQTGSPGKTSHAQYGIPGRRQPAEWRTSGPTSQSAESTRSQQSAERSPPRRTRQPAAESAAESTRAAGRQSSRARPSGSESTPTSQPDRSAGKTGKK